jgi:ferredoxin, 2Fe-2S
MGGENSNATSGDYWTTTDNMVAACATCHVLIREGANTLDEADDDENDQLDNAWGLEPASRLACCVRVKEGDITVALPKHTRNHAREH